jgi:hypothetical protein
MRELDTHLGERYYKESEDLEEKYTDEIINVIHRAINRQLTNEGPPARRDAHAFDTGCVEAVFCVDPELSPELSQGVFVPGKKYPAWVRFSNGNFVRTSPRSPDARGMAIKLMGVEGQKLINDEINTQDFILISHPTFFVNDLQSYVKVLDRFLEGSFWKQWVSAPLKLPSLRSAWIAFRVNARWILNPLNRQYWSMTPYCLGANTSSKMAVKYTAKPNKGAGRKSYPDLSAYVRPGFSLKKQINRRLAVSEAKFDFYIQRYVDDRTPVEDSTVEWKESVSKLEHVAEIIIPSQDIMNPDRAWFCENLSFNPWNCLAEHKPLGVVNRVRRRIYLDISKFRHHLNKADRTEPQPK